MTYTTQKIIQLSERFEKIASHSLVLAHKKRKLSELEQLEYQLADARRAGDNDWAKELKERIDELKNQKK